MSRTISFQFERTRYTIGDDEVVTVARQAIAQGLPAKAQRFKSWALMVDNVPLGVKWIFSRVTGIPEMSYNSSLAQDILGERLGMDVVNLTHEERRAKTGRAPKIPTVKKQRITKGEYAYFFEVIRERLPQLVSSEHLPFKFHASSNYLQIQYEAFGGCHYEIALRRNHHEIGLHFESSRRVNHINLQAFLPHVEQLTNELGETVKAEPWGNQGVWARVWVEYEHRPLTNELAIEYADKMAKFIAATYSILQRAFQARVAQRQERNAKPEGLNDSPLYTILDREVESLRAFLQGRSDHRPTGEKICDWIQFCYLFELYPEGHDLFKLLASDGINPWYLERTVQISKNL